MPILSFSPQPRFQRAAAPIVLGALVAGVYLLSGVGHAWAKFDAEAKAILYYKNADPKTVLSSLAEQLAIEPPPEYRGDPAKKITINAREVTLEQAMDQIAKATGGQWWRTKDDRFVVGDARTYNEAKLKGEVAPERIPAAAAKPGEAAAKKPGTEKSTAAAPTPAPAKEEPRATLVFNQGKIEQVLMALSQQTGVRISPEGKTSGLRVDVIAKDQPLTDILDMIANPKGLVWWKKADGSYGIADKNYYETNVLPEQAIQRIFRPNHIKAEDFEKAIKGILTPKIGKVASDPRTNKVIVTDLPPVIETIERLLQEIDIQLVTRVFQIHYADTEDIAKQIEDYKSGPGTIKVDPNTHQIVVTDLLQNILRMEKLIDVLDVGPEIVVYDVNNIGLDGKELDDLKSIIDSIRTKDLLFETNPTQGTFILEDVPEVQDKVEKILKAFDQPVKQVLIEAEVLSTSYEKNLSYSLNWTYSADLFGAAADKLPGVTLPGTPSGNSAVNGGYRNLNNEFPLLNSSTSSGIGISATNLTKEALITLQAALTDRSTNVLLQPQLLVKNQESARINVGSEEPYLTTFYNNYNSNIYGGGASVGQNFVPSGLTLELTPSISNTGIVEMEIKLNDDNASTEKFDVGGNTGTIPLIHKETKEVDTILLIPDGETRMLAGLLSVNKSVQKSGIPILVDIPLIGPLFGSYTNDDTKQNLMVFLTPTIVEEHGTVKVTHEGRRGRPLTIEQEYGQQGPTTSTLTGEKAQETAPSDHAASGTLEKGATLSSESAASQMPYLLGQEQSGKEEAETEGKGPRTSSYTSSVGSPVGSLTDVKGEVTTTSSEKATSQPEEKPQTPREGQSGRTSVAPAPVRSAPSNEPAPAPSSPETKY